MARPPKKKQSRTHEPAATVTLWEVIRDVYLSFDRRTLGLSRILLGWLLVCDLFRRTWDWEDMYSTLGVLPSHLSLFRPQARDNFSLFHAFSTPAELWVLWAVILATYVCLLVGYRTKLMQILALVWVTSMNGRILLIENGGYVVHNLLLLWTCFLPLGDRFSVDSLLASLRRKREGSVRELNDRGGLLDPRMRTPHVSLLMLVVLLQLSAVYYFNFLHKSGPNWHNGTAVHFVLYVDRMVTPLIGLVREHIPFVVILGMTNMVMAAEALLALLFLSPLFTTWMRRAAIVVMNALHIGFGSTFVLGPFAWSLCVFSTLLFRTDDWELAIRTMRREDRRRRVLVDTSSPGAFFAARLLVRCDHFELLDFRRRVGVPGGLAVKRPDGTVATYAQAVGDIVRALPLGPGVAWLATLPGIAEAIEWAWKKAEQRSLAGWLDLEVPPSGQPIQEPAPIRRAFAKGGAVLRELGVLAMWVAAINQAAAELWVINRRWQVPHPEVTRVLAQKLRFLQGWFMFSPNPVMDDGTIMVDARTIDGRTINPLTGKPPNWDLIHTKSFGYNQIWSDYFNRIQLPANRAYREAADTYMKRLPERTGNPNDAIAWAEVYWIHDMNPPWGRRSSYSYSRKLLWSFGEPPPRPTNARPDGPPLPPGQVRPHELRPVLPGEPPLYDPALDDPTLDDPTLEDPALEHQDEAPNPDLRPDPVGRP